MTAPEARCPACGHLITSHYEIGCALKAECGCPIEINWHGWIKPEGLG